MDPDVPPPGPPAAVAAPYRAGSRADFDRLYVESRPRLLQTLTALLRDPATAEDCVQEAFTRAYAVWGRWKPTAPPEAWLHRIALHVAISQRRRERLRSAEELVRRLGRPPVGADPAAAGERLDLRAALRRLPPRQAAAIILRHLHGYSNREIGTALGIPERTVASRLAAARRRLARELGVPAGADGSVEELGTSAESGVLSVMQPDTRRPD